MATLGPYDFTSPSTRFSMDYSVSQNQAGNYSVVTITLNCWNGPGGSTASSFGGSGSQIGSIDGYGNITVHSAGSNFLPSGYAANQLRWSDTASSGQIAHDAAGNHANMTVRLAIAYGTINVAYTGTVTFPRISKVPGKPPTPVFVSAATTTIDYTFAAPSDNGGSAITSYTHQSATDAGFTANLQTWTDNSSPGQATALAPGTSTYIHVRANNAIGSGAYSAALVQTTLPSVPPTFTVASSPSGTSATLTFSPPGGVTGVTKYTWERRVTGTTPTTASADSATTTAVVTGLTPGTSYDWRASAWIGTYQSPVSAWQTLVQAKPNTNPGDYFDGSTVDVADLNYQWGTTGAGTANASISTAAAVGVTGWEATIANGAAVMYRVTAGFFEGFAARVAWTVDATGAGQRFGQAGAAGFWADVVPAVSYNGSIYVKANRTQRVAAELTWYTTAGAVVSRATGTAVVLAADTWTRLDVTATSPATGEWAAVKVIDVTGTSWATWKGGDVIDLDGAMIALNELLPYFDGDTPEDGIYVYEWVDPTLPDASPSKRTPLVEQSGSIGALTVSGRAILDPTCTPPAPPRPPVISNTCVTEAGVWRRYWGNIDPSEIPDYLTVVPTFEVHTISNDVSQVRIRVYPNPNALAPAAVDPNSWVSEQIVSYVPKNTVLTIDGVHQRAWGSVAGAASVTADHLLYGSNGSPATWPVLSCDVPYVISLDLPVDIPQGDSYVNTYLTTRY